jgi:subtilisin family serine protease
MSDKKEYIVTVRNRSDIDSFYDDMDNNIGTEFIPNRKVEIVHIRETSRNTHYYLTDEESNLLRNEPRVLSVELLPKEMGIEPILLWSQTGNFEKSNSIDTNDKNWGLYSITNRQPLSNWGTDGSFTQTTQTINTTSSGKNVDVVVVDAHINGNHPEFAVNVDGTGGSRFVAYNWFQHSSSLGYTTTQPYSYSYIETNHGTHVAGIVAGNTQGWARDANIYNINFNYTSAGGPSGDWTLFVFDYIREFHRTKPINNVTGRKNPTIVTNSWGYGYNDLNMASIIEVTYRGTTTDLNGLTNAQKKVILENNGVPVPNESVLHLTPARVAALDADVIDAINDGLIVLGASGNSYWNCATTDSVDYGNSVYSTNVGSIYHSKGMSPGSAGNAICVGSVGVFLAENKSNFSNYGSRVNVYAPGRFITSSVYDTTAATEFGITLANDPRDSNYKIGSLSGTSMATPQVAGVLSCLLENFPSLTQSECLTYLVNNSTLNRITSTGGNAGDYLSLGDSSNNRYLFYKKERGLTGYVAINTVKNRSSTGNVYPRTKIRRFG